jgi:hypothetical protein
MSRRVTSERHARHSLSARMASLNHHGNPCPQPKGALAGRAILDVDTPRTAILRDLNSLRTSAGLYFISGLTSNNFAMIVFLLKPAVENIQCTALKIETNIRASSTGGVGFAVADYKLMVLENMFCMLRITEDITGAKRWHLSTLTNSSRNVSPMDAVKRAHLPRWLL